MSLTTMQIPKKDMTVLNTVDLEGTQTDCQKTSSISPKQHHTAEAKTSSMQRHETWAWVTKPLEGPNSGRDVYHYFPVGYHRKKRSNRHLPIFRSRNNRPNEALEYVQAYIDNLLVITRGILEDHLAKLKGLQEDARCRPENNRC